MTRSDLRRWSYPLCALGLSVACALPGDSEDETSPAATTASTGESSAAETEPGSTSAPMTAGEESSSSGMESSASGEETTPTEPQCGDGRVDDGEMCDEGPLNSDHGACTGSCHAAVCGDGLVFDGAEVCDDGRNEGGYDGCEADCSGLGPRCGDGVLQEEHETCEDDLHGRLCTVGCELAECSTLDLVQPDDELCAPEAQTNAEVAGVTPLGPFTGVFAAQAWDDYDSSPVLIVTAYDPEDLCQAHSYLLIAAVERGDDLPKTVAAQVLVAIDGEIATTTGTLTLLSDDYTNPDAGPECWGSTAFEIEVEGEGWSLSGSAEPGCCWSSHNLWVA